MPRSGSWRCAGEQLAAGRAPGHCPPRSDRAGVPEPGTRTTGGDVPGPQPSDRESRNDGRVTPASGGSSRASGSTSRVTSGATSAGPRRHVEAIWSRRCTSPSAARPSGSCLDAGGSRARDPVHTPCRPRGDRRSTMAQVAMASGDKVGLLGTNAEFSAACAAGGARRLRRMSKALAVGPGGERRSGSCGAAPARCSVSRGGGQLVVWLDRDRRDGRRARRHRADDRHRAPPRGHVAVPRHGDIVRTASESPASAAGMYSRHGGAGGAGASCSAPAWRAAARGAGRGGLAGGFSAAAS